MKINRRKFLAVAGGAAAVGVAGKVVSSESSGHSTANKTQKRWGMVINLSLFRQYPELNQRCINACNRIHNIPHIESPKEEVKWIWAENFEHAFIEQENHHLPDHIMHSEVLLLCNHCDNPPCTSVCPTKATWKRETDGIVMMDWHRCIGCRYCIAACPYGSRSFNWTDPRENIDKIDGSFPTRTKGVVEKCTFCAERIVKGQMPACVEACKDNEYTYDAMFFGDLDDPESEIRQVLGSDFSIRRKPELGTQPEVYYIL